MELLLVALAVVITGKELVQWDEADSLSANQDHSFLNHKVCFISTQFSIGVNSC